MSSRIFRLVWLLVVALGVAGCSNEGERGINKDLDKPKPVEKK